MITGGDAIGGYPSLDLRRAPWIHDGALLLNSGRSCLEYLLSSWGEIGVIYVPSYICSAIYDTLDKLEITYRPYAIDGSLEIAGEIPVRENDIVIYPNYMGMKDEYCDHLSRTYSSNLIIDCAQSLYYENTSAHHVMYSPRKFVGVPDGGCLYSSNVNKLFLDEDRSAGQLEHLAKRIEDGAEAGYMGFLAAEDRISRAPMRWMSPLTRYILEAADHDQIRQRRTRNYALLHSMLGASNSFALAPRPGVSPIAYPFYGGPELRAALRAQRIYVPTYWPNVMANPALDLEQDLALNLLALPIDQRLDEDDIHRIAEAVKRG